MIDPLDLSLFVITSLVLFCDWWSACWLFYGRSSGNGGGFGQMHMAADSKHPRFRNVDSSVSAKCVGMESGEPGRSVGERILEHCKHIRLIWTDNSAMAEHTYDADHLPNWSGVQCIAHDRHWYTR